jgi:hypothetical protein
MRTESLVAVVYQSKSRILAAVSSPKKSVETLTTQTFRRL